MKSIAQAAEANGYEVELIFCSSDPNSLDGVVIPKRKCCILDATSPHVLEPSFPGACETIVNIGAYWDKDILQENRDEIMKTSAACSAQHARPPGIWRRAGSLLSDSYRFALDCTDTAKVARYASRLSRREFGQPKENLGHEEIRLLSAVTPHGVLFFEETVEKLCSRVFVIEDEYGASSRLLLAHLRTHALTCGHDVISCYCPMSPLDKLDHLLIPDLGIGFVTSNSWYQVKLSPFRRIHMRALPPTSCCASAVNAFPSIAAPAATDFRGLRRDAGSQGHSRRAGEFLHFRHGFRCRRIAAAKRHPADGTR